MKKIRIVWIGDKVGNNITVFVDESGIVSKGKRDKQDYFIITLLFVKNERIDYVKKLFKKYRLQVANKREDLKSDLKEKREIKGSVLSEKEKYHIYSKIIDKCNDDFELAVIVLDNKKATARFKSNSSRVFNYLIKQYLECYFKKFSKYKDLNSIYFVIDERNVATKSTYTLEEYLNTELNLMHDFSEEEIKAEYSASQKYLLLQMADFISNTFYRKYQKNINSNNIELLLTKTCKGKVFKFPL